MHMKDERIQKESICVQKITGAQNSFIIVLIIVSKKKKRRKKILGDNKLQLGKLR